MYRALLLFHGGIVILIVSGATMRYRDEWEFALSRRGCSRRVKFALVTLREGWLDLNTAAAHGRTG